MDALAVNVAVVGIGADDAPAKAVVERLEAAGHHVLARKQLAPGAPLLEVLTGWIENAEIDVVLAVAPDTDPVRAAMSPLVTRALPGFGELLRAAAFPEIGSAAMLLDGEAARCGSTYVFVLPGTLGAVKVAMDQLLIPQLDSRTRPVNLASKLPRLRGVPPPADAFAEREITDVGTPPPPGKTVPPPPRASKTMPPPVPQSQKSPKTPTKTPPLGVVLRATPVDPAAAADAEMIRSDAAILIPPAEIVEPPVAETPPVAEAPPPAEAAADKPHADTVAADQLGAFVMSLEQHAQKLRAEKSEVGPLPKPPSKTQPPPITRKTDAEMKAVRDASVAEAISKAEPLPTASSEPPAKAAEPAAKPAERRKTTPPPVPEAATSEPPRRKKNETTPQQWAKASDAMEKIAPSAVRTTGTLSAASPVLAQGDRVIVIPQHRARRTWLWVPLALAVGVGGGFLVKNIVVSGNRTASAEPQPEAPEQVVKVESVEAVPSPAAAPTGSAGEPAATGSAATAVPVTPEIEMDPSGGNLTALAQGHAHHGSAATTAAVAAEPAAGSAAGSALAANGSAAGSDEAFDPRTHPNIAPASPDCDEASCILEGYKRECCARYKPAEVVVDAGPSGPPQTLDKAAVKAGLAELKPAVEQCGEQHPAKGEVSITLTVSADGHVTASTVAASPDPELGQCVAKVLERATFEKTQGVTVFTYPFMF